jgi:5-formyltetrahydrofolate cyclo-ligase
MMPAEIAAWRRSERERLLELRRSLSSAEQTSLARSMLLNLMIVLHEQTFKTLGIYWPIQREIDIRPVATALCGSRSLTLALPVVVQKGAPLEYWRWRLGDRMTRGFWNIPVPKQRAPIIPDAVVAPLVGFQNCFRLGYGGGYFDRTLGAAKTRPYAIGLGYEFSRVDGFVAQPHDIPMDVIVTEESITHRAALEEVASGRR